MLYLVGAVVWLFIGQIIGRISSREYFNQTPSEDLGFLGKIKRTLLFPFSYSNWNFRYDRYDEYKIPFSPRHWVKAARKDRPDPLKETYYRRFISILWPLKLVPALTGIVIGIVELFAIAVWSFLGIIFHAPDTLATMLKKILSGERTVLGTRNILKALLIGTWGQSILGAPVWIGLVGWELTALNILLSLLVLKFGKQRLIRTEKSRNDIAGLREAIEKLQQFRTEELDSPLSDVSKLFENLGVLITHSEREKEDTDNTRKLLAQSNHPLAGSFDLACRQLDDLIQNKKAERNQLSEIAKGLEAGRKDLELHEKLLKTNKFIEEKRPGSTNIAQIMQNAQSSIDALQEMIRRASQTHTRSLATETPDSAFSSLPVEDIAADVLRGMDHVEQIGKRSVNLRLKEVGPLGNTPATPRALATS